MKKTIAVLLLIILALPFSAQAHTTLTASTPAAGDVVTEKLEEVQLSFGTAIEQGSTMSIKGQEAVYEVEGITLNENSMAGSVAEELPNGAYTIQWKIIGADGHPIEGEVPFEINIETVEEPVTEEEGTADEEPAVKEEGTADEGPATEEVQTAASDAGTSAEKSNTLVTVLIAAAALLLIVGMFRLLKKKQ